MDTLDNIKTGGQQERMLSEESRKKFTEICEQEFRKYMEIHQFNPVENGSFRGAQIRYGLSAMAHMKADGNIAKWEFEELQIGVKAIYDP